MNHDDANLLVAQSRIELRRFAPNHTGAYNAALDSIARNLDLTTPAALNTVAMPLTVESVAPAASDAAIASLHQLLGDRLSTAAPVCEQHGKDENFEAKFWDVIGVYLDPPDNAVVLCCDEKSQCQALQRSQPGLPLGQGHFRTVTHDYYRHGTVTLFAALDYLSGKVISQVAPRHRHNEWLKFLKKLDSEITEDLSIHLIVDNYSTHKHQKVRRWLERHSRFHLHFTPTSALWMNMVERFFRDLSQQAILPGSFGSVAELVDTINLYLA